MQTHPEKIFIDCREFVQGKFTGIGRVLEGLLDALAQNLPTTALYVLTHDAHAVPERLKRHQCIQVNEIAASFLRSEKVLADFVRKNSGLFISPYRKLPLIGHRCKMINIVHDVLDLTHPTYRKRFKGIIDVKRLKMALKKADLTWYDSSWSMAETKKLVGISGKNPRVRYLAVDDKFYIKRTREDIDDTLRRYQLQSEYILVLGNGLPHKNLGIILQSAAKCHRAIVFAGVPENNQAFWQSLYPGIRAAWIPFVAEDDLPAIIQGAFCLAQPSTAEGYGYPPLEAMAGGIPAIVSRIPVLVETTGGCALTAEPGDPTQWRNAFLALENSDVYAMQVSKGTTWVRKFKGYTAWNKYVADIRELING